MAVITDKTLLDLFNSITKLTKTIENDKNSFGAAQNGATRLGRGGSANARAVRESNQNLEALADNLEELHKSFKSGGKSLADHFRETIKNISPLNAAFGKLEDAVTEAAQTQTKAYNMAAKHTLEYIKKVSGNVDSLKELNKEYADLVSSVNDLVDNQEDYSKNQELFNKKLQKIYDARAKVEARNVHGGKPVVSGPLNLFLKNLAKNSDAKMSGNAQYGVNQLNDQYKAVNSLTESFLKDMTSKMKTAQVEFQQAVSGFTKSVGSALIKDAKEVPNFISSRLRYGFESNEFLDAFRMGMSTDELNQIRSANRDIINGLTGFGKKLDIASTESLRVWSNNAKQVGLIGQEAAQFTSDWMRSAYNTGRQYSDALNSQLTNDAQQIQQAFGGNIQQSAKMIQDYTSQIYNLARFNQAQTVQQQEALQQELKVRMLHTKYMGYDIEFMKQQQQMRYNDAFSDIGDRIRSAILGQVAVNSVKTQAGLSDEEARVYSLAASKSGYQLNANEEQTYQSALNKMSSYESNRMNAVSQATRTGGIAGLASVGLKDVVYQRTSSMAGIDRRGNTEAGQRAIAQQRSRGEISFEDFLKTTETGAKEQRESISAIEGYVQEIAESMKGFGSLPGAAIAGAIGGGITQLLTAVLKRRLAGAALETMTKGGAGRVGASLLGRIGLGSLAAGGGTTAAGGAAAGGTLGTLATGAAGVTAAGLGGYGIGTILSKWGDNAQTSTNGAYKAATQALNPLGYGASSLSNRFADNNLDTSQGIAERVAKTGTFNEEDIRQLTRIKQVGKWFTSDSEDQSDRESAIAQLNQLASYRRNKNSAPADRPRSTAIAMSVDNMNGIQRDANGNPINQGTAPDPLNKLVELTQQQLDLEKQNQEEARQRDEKNQNLAARRETVKEHMANMAESIENRFSMTV